MLMQIPQIRLEHHKSRFTSLCPCPLDLCFNC